MINYNNGKIYVLTCFETGLIYIGSTTKQYLSQRLTSHVDDFKRFQSGKDKRYMTSFEIIKNDNYQITLLESYPCNSKDELTAREAFYIRSMNCVNKIIPDRTPKEYRQDNKEKLSKNAKEYYRNNKDYFKVYQKEYHQDNKEKIVKKAKEYYQQNKPEIQQKKQIYYQNNKTQLNENTAKYRNNNNYDIMCEYCGREINKLSYSRHCKTDEHLESVEQIKLLTNE